MVMAKKSYTELQELYDKYFSLGALSCPLDNKFALISLICYITKRAKEKNPDVNCYKVIKQIIAKEENQHDEVFIYA